MTPRKFFVGRAVVFCILLILGFGFFIYSTYFPIPKEMEVIHEGDAKDSEAFGFVWKFEESEELNLDGIPKTIIFLEVTYSDGTAQTKRIDTVSSSCNNLPDSTSIQCYGAGLGYVFDITKGDESYLVQRKMFEEAVPGYEPPSYEYEVVMEFPLSV